jgi:hypothetical protein
MRHYLNSSSQLALHTYICTHVYIKGDQKTGLGNPSLFIFASYSTLVLDTYLRSIYLHPTAPCPLSSPSLSTRKHPYPYPHPIIPRIPIPLPSVPEALPQDKSTRHARMHTRGIRSHKHKHTTTHPAEQPSGAGRSAAEEARASPQRAGGRTEISRQAGVVVQHLHPSLHT